MKTGLFDFDLPPEHIALRPAEPRESARLLEVQARALSDHTVATLPDLLRSGDVLVVNDTRVIPARLKGLRGAARIEVTLHMRQAPDTWAAFARPARRLRPGDLVRFGDTLSATVETKQAGGEVHLRFDRGDADLLRALEAAGEMPLPPYIASKRATDARDREDYQTSYAREPGAVAAPTAGLHLTPPLLEQIRQTGVAVTALTLHVGAGTFLPVKAEDTDDHRMHAEIGTLSKAAADQINQARRHGGRIVAAGTTSLRLLESAASADGTVQPFSGATDIFITPGYRFRTADLLLTNFHLPRSTLFMLVSAFSGLERMQAAYRHAIGGGYRFYSYGDACLLHRSEP